MLTEKLKNDGLFTEETAEMAEESKQKHIARKILNDAVKNLICAMRSTELDEVYSREEIERFVLIRMEAYEKKLFSLDEDEFDAYLEAYAFEAFMRSLCHDSI